MRMEKEPLTFPAREEPEERGPSRHIPPLRDHDEESPESERGREAEASSDKALLEGLEMKRDPNAEADIESARADVERRLENVSARLAEEKEKLASAHDGLGLSGSVRDSASIRALEEAEVKLETEYATIEHAADLSEVFDSLGDTSRYSQEELGYIAEHGTTSDGKQVRLKRGGEALLEKDVARKLAGLRLSGVTKLTWSQLDSVMDIAEALLREAWGRIRAFFGFKSG